MTYVVNTNCLCIRVNTPSLIGVSLDGKQIFFSVPLLSGNFAINGHDSRNMLRNIKPFDSCRGISSNPIIIEHLQKNSNSWREDVVYKLMDRDWFVHVASKTVFVSQSNSASWGNWKKFSSPYSENNPGVIKLSNVEWKSLRNLYVSDIWVMHDGNFTETSRRLRLHEVMTL